MQLQCQQPLKLYMKKKKRTLSLFFQICDFTNENVKKCCFFLVLMKFSVDFLFYPKMMTFKEQVRIIYNNYAAESSLLISVSA